VRLDDVNVVAVEFLATMVVVTVALRRRRLVCPHCAYKTRWRYDTRPVDSRWRHLDLGTWHLELRASLRRLRCPTHGVVVEAVPFARPGAHLTRDLDDLLAWLATRMDKSSVARLCRVSWRTVGRACERVVETELDPDRLNGLFRIGVDEISWRKHHKYLTLVVDHDRGKVIWGAKGRDALTLDAFFDDLGPERSSQLTAVSMDLGPAYLKSVRAEGHAPQATICLDPFHVVALATKALDEVRRPIWQQLRQLLDPAIATFPTTGPGACVRYAEATERRFVDRRSGIEPRCRCPRRLWCEAGQAGRACSLTQLALARAVSTWARKLSTSATSRCAVRPCRSSTAASMRAGRRHRALAQAAPSSFDPRISSSA
jgi:transposase